MKSLAPITITNTDSIFTDHKTFISYLSEQPKRQIKMKLFAVFASFATAGQYQGVNEDGNEWTASVTEDTFAFQENGESLVATGSVVSDAGLVFFKFRKILN